MRILLVTLTEYLPFAITTALNPMNDYCAIVVDEVEPAAGYLEKINYPKNKIFYFYDLPECLSENYYDCVVCVAESRDWKKLADAVRNAGCPKDKFVNLALVQTADNFLLERAMRYWTEHCTEFEIFVTGLSHAEIAFMPKYFKRKLFNFARGTQDLYFDYQIAKFAFDSVNNIQGGGYVR